MKRIHGTLKKNLSLEDAVSSLENGRLPHPSVEDILTILVTCRREKSHAHALRLHTYMLRNGIEIHESFGNHLICMLADIGRLDDARNVFDKFTNPTAWSWSSLIAAYVKCAKPHHALTLYEEMQKDIHVCPTGHTFVAVLKACAKLKDLKKGLEVHDTISVMRLLKTSPFVGSALVDMYAKCGNLMKAQQAFSELPMRDVVSWTALIAGYTEHGLGDNALKCFEQMRCEGVFPDPVTLVCSLKACGMLRLAQRGQVIHCEIEQQGGPIRRNQVFGSALVDMYCKCGSLVKAQEIFKKLPDKDVVVWNALIAGYADHGCGEQALDFFKKMKSQGIVPNAVTFVCCLKACASMGAITEGQELHDEVDKQGRLEENIFVGSTLVDMYGKFGMLKKAQEVFDKLSGPNVVSWTALIAAYTEHGHGKDALLCFEKMHIKNVDPNALTFLWVLKACGNEGMIDKGIGLHGEIMRLGFLQNLHVGSALVDMYCKCGCLVLAREAFDHLQAQDTVCWNALIAGYVEHGLDDRAIDCLGLMQPKGVAPDDVTFLCILKACGSLKAVEKGMEIHAEIERRGLFKKNLSLGCALIDMYANCGLVFKAQQVFDRLVVKDLSSWNALIMGYAEGGHGKKALQCYEQMRSTGLLPDAVSHICALKACGSIRDVDACEKIYGEIKRQGLLKEDEVLGNMLVDALAKCGLLATAQGVLYSLPVRNVVSWTALIAGHVDSGRGEEALCCLKEMQSEGVIPNNFTFACSLQACRSIGAIDKGIELQDDIEKLGLLDGDLVIGNILIDMYAKFGLLGRACEVFNRLQVRDTISWTALIAGYAEQGHDKAAIKCYEQMQQQGFRPDALTFMCSLKACGNLGSLDKGKEIHVEIERGDLLKQSMAIGNALVDMYGKCGSLLNAQTVFDRLSGRNVVSWTALMAGYAQWGQCDDSCTVFERMLGEGVKPDPVTFVVVLSACSRSGIFSRSQTYYEAMSEDYGILPTREHQSCVVDNLGRAGCVDMAVAMMRRMPHFDVMDMWHNVLGACRHAGNVVYAEQAFEQTVRPGNSFLGPLSSLHVYADADLQEEASTVEVNAGLTGDIGMILS